MPKSAWVTLHDCSVILVKHLIIFDLHIYVISIIYYINIINIIFLHFNIFIILPYRWGGTDSNPEPYKFVEDFWYWKTKQNKTFCHSKCLLTFVDLNCFVRWLSGDQNWKTFYHTWIEKAAVISITRTKFWLATKDGTCK